MKRSWPGRSISTSPACGSFTLRTISASREDGVGVGDDPRPLGLELGVGDRAALAGAGLDQHLVPVLGQLPHPGRGHATRYSSALISWDSDLIG